MQNSKKILEKGDKNLKILNTIQYLQECFERLIPVSDSVHDTRGMKVLQIEVKSGNNYKKHPALNRVKAVEAWKNNPSYVFCKGNIETENGIIYLPWYEIMFLRQETIPLNMIYEIDISGL